MPGGLNEVVVPVGANTSGYKTEWLSVLPVLRQVQAAQKGIIEQGQQMAALRGLSGSGLAGNPADIAKSNTAIRETLASLREYQPAMAAATKASADFSGMSAQEEKTVRALATAIDHASTASANFASTHGGAAVAARATTDALKAQSETVADTFRSFGLLGETVKGQQEAARSYGAQIDDLKTSLMGGADAASVLREGLKIRDADVASLGIVRDTARDATSALTDAAAAATFMSRVTAGGSGGGGGGTTSPAIAAVIARNLAQQGYGPTPGGTSPVNTALAALLGGAGSRPGGGGGGGAGGGGGFLGGLLGGISGGGAFDPGTSARAGTLVTGFLGTWLPRLHYALMGINEVLATAGPAAIAAGAAAAVGMEGGQTAYGRLSAINTVGQSLGPALGMTSGQFLGMGNTLQKAQTLADPAVWSLMGAVTSSMKSGGLGGSFTQMGTNTVDMIDRFASKVTSALTGSEGKQIAGLVSQGTNYLQQFGAIAGNVGLTLLHTAPALPGVGGDLLTTVQGITRGLANATGAIPTPLLGLGLAAEAGGRYGPGLVGSIGNYAARVPGGFLGTAARTATAADVTAGLATTAGDTIAGTGAAGFLGSLGGLDLAAAGAGAYAIGKIITAQSPAQQKVGGLQGIANQANFTQAFGDLLGNISTFGSQSGGAQALSPMAGMWQGMQEGTGLGKGFNLFGGAKDTWQGLGSLFGVPEVRTPAGTYSAAQMNAASQFNNLLSAGPAIQGILGGGSIANAYSIADMAGLQGSQLQQLISGSAAQKLNIKNQLLNEQAGYKVMASSPGVYGMNVNAVQAMSGLQGTQLSTVNSAWDQILSNATGGTAAATGFSGGIQALADLSLPAAQKAPSAKTVKSIAQALTGFTSPASQSAWAAYSSPSTTSPGVLQQVGSMTDWLRTAMTVSGGGINQGQFNQASAYEMKQLLPYAKQSPAALAQLGVLSQQMGGPGADPALTQAENYKKISQSIDGAAGSAKQYNSIMNKATIATAGVSQQALQFGSTLKTNVYSALSGGATGLPKVSQDMQSFKAAFTGGGKIDTSGFKTAAQSIAADLSSVGASGKDVGAILSQSLQGKGLSGSQITSAIKQVQGDISGIQSKNVKVTATADASQVKQLDSLIKGLAGKNVNIHATTNAAAVQNLITAISAVQGKTVTITTIVTEINRVLTQYIGAATPVGGIAPATLVGGGGGMRLTNHASGWRVPGYGGGDKWPAWLEGGEAVVPKELTPAVAPFLAMHGVPGFTAGMIPSALAGMYSGSPGSPPLASLPIPSAAQKVLDQLLAELAKAGAWKQAGVNIINGITYSLSGTGSDAAKVGRALVTRSAADAKALASQFTTEMNYARGTAAAAVTGQGYGTAGLLGGFTVPPAGGTGAGAAAPGTPGYNPTAWNAAAATAASTTTPAQTVQQQMQSYLSSEQSFTKDLKTLSKDHLAKGITSQLVAAGPVQGDALAQSILGGTGGVGAANKLWAQIGKASNALGAQAGMSMYGGHLSPGLTGGTVTMNNSISISVSAPGGAGGDLNLTSAQIKTITEAVQAKLLQQARRNPKTGVKLPGKSA